MVLVLTFHQRQSIVMVMHWRIAGMNDICS